MVIDDDEPTNYISTMVFDEMDCAKQLLVFESGESALHYIRQTITKPGENDSLPDMIFLDINMPRMNGWEFLEAFQQINPPLAQTVIIMLTTSMNPDDEQRAYDLAAVAGFENKPITPGMVQRLIHTHFTKRARVEQLSAGSPGNGGKRPL